MDFFGLGISELFFIVMFCLLFFKPDEIPGIVRAIVTNVKKFRSMTTKVKQDIGDIYHREIESKFEEAKEELVKETHGFRSKIIGDYDSLNQQLSKVQQDIANFDQNHHSEADEKLLAEQPKQDGSAILNAEPMLPNTNKIEKQ